MDKLSNLIPKQYESSPTAVYIEHALAVMNAEVTFTLLEVLNIYRELDISNMTRIGMTLEACEKKLNQKYCSTRKELLAQLYDESEKLRGVFFEIFDEGCTGMNEYMCKRYYSIARMAIFEILEMIFETGKSTLILEVEKRGMMSKAELDEEVNLQDQGCRRLFEAAFGLWSVPTDIHDQFEYRFQKYKADLVELAKTTNRASVTTKRKATTNASDKESAAKSATTLTPFVAPASSKNSVAEQRRKAALYRDELMAQKAGAKTTAKTGAAGNKTGNTINALDVRTSGSSAKGGGAVKKRKVSDLQIVEIDDDGTFDGGDNDKADPVARAIAESRRKEQLRKDEIIARLQSQAKPANKKGKGTKK